MKTLLIALGLTTAVGAGAADDGFYIQDWRTNRTTIEDSALVVRTPLSRMPAPKVVGLALQDSPEPTRTGPYGLTFYLASEPDQRPGMIPVVVLGDQVFIDQVVVSPEGTRQPFLCIERITDRMRPADLLERARRLFGLHTDRALDQRTRKVEPVASREPPPRASDSDTVVDRTLDSLPAPGSSGGR